MIVFFKFFLYSIFFDSLFNSLSLQKKKMLPNIEKKMGGVPNPTNELYHSSNHSQRLCVFIKIIILASAVEGFGACPYLSVHNK